MSNESNYWYVNSLIEWRRKWKPSKADLYRLKVLTGMNHPVARQQQRLIDFKNDIVAQIDAAIDREI